MERSATLENTAREVASMVVAKCVHPVSNRPYTMGQVRDAMKEAEFSVQPTTARSVKQQFLDCVRAIQKKGNIDIQRARMELAIVFGDAVTSNDITRRLETEAQVVLVRTNDDTGLPVEDNNGDIDRIQFLIDPSQYRTIDAIAKETGGTLEMIRHAVTQEGDADVSSELERITLRQTKHDVAAALKLSTVQTNNEEHPSQHQSDSVVAALAAEVGAVLSSLDHNEHPHHPQHDKDDTANMGSSSRKKNKKAQKKSKKAKRREKEEAALRLERKDVEIARREEREFRLGKAQATTEGDVGGGIVNSTVEGNVNVGGGGATKSCNTCGGAFTPAQYRVHFRSDWHRYNIKLKMKGASYVDEKEFLMIDSDAFFNGTT